jgi:hypothetical protein
MVFYPDVHNSEERAKRISQGVLDQNPDSIFLEADNKEVNAYLMDSITNFPTLKHIFRVFDLSLDQAGVDEDMANKAIYLPPDEVIKSSMEAIFNHLREKATPQVMTAIKQPDQTWKSDKKDKAMNSLLHQQGVRLSDDKSTLQSRLAVVATQTEANMHMIDMERSRIWRYGAKKVPELPNDPRKVKKILSWTRKGRWQEQGKENPYAAGVKKLLGASMNARDKTMALQTKEDINSRGYKNSAVVVGRQHVEGIAKLLKKEYNIQIEN